MNKKLITLISACLLFFGSASLAQNVAVNPLTGAGSVVIPIYTFSSGQVTLPVSLSYNGSGVKTKDIEGTAGMGWNLNAGGQISRVVRGIPDDCTKDNSGATMVGWMSTSNTVANYASTFTILNNGTSCSNNAIDIANMNDYIFSEYDTEPDMFYISAPGLSCQMIYDRTTAKFHPVNYQDMVIAYTSVGGTGNNASDIASFTITNDKGIKYVFAAPESVTQTTKIGSGSEDYFKGQYYHYVNGITFSDSWKLTSITDASGNGVILSYSPTSVRNSTDPLELFLGGSTTASFLYNVLQAVTPQVLTNIVTTNVNSTSDYLGFEWYPAEEKVQTGQSVIETIEGMGRYFQFAYSNVTYSPTSYARSFLTNFTDVGCATPVNYNFSYIGVNPVSGTTTLADSTSNQTDYWGYYSTSASTSTLLPAVNVNPSTAGYPRYLIDVSSSPGSAYQYTLTGSNRAVTAASVADGALNKITYAQGGNTNIVYEPNDYYDTPSGTVIQGAGIRVKQIIDSAGSGSTNNIIRNYTYVNPTGVTNAGYSSGAPITLPQFAFTTPYGGTATGLSLWTTATAISAYDLSSDDHTIMYAYSRVSQTGAGSTLYNYNVPATYLSASAGPICSGCSNPTEWTPTVDLAASPSCTNTYAPIADLTYSYPFIPNPNYDFERGLPIKIVNYNDAGTEVGESDYTYSRSYTPTPIVAFKVDFGPTSTGTEFYNRYTVFYNTSELTASITKKVFDSNTLSQAQTSTTNYTYGSSYHKLLTKETATNSDNSTVTTNFSYIKDYSASPGSNANVNGIFYLQQQNINAPVETYQEVTRNGNTLITSGALTLFSGFTVGSFTNYLPSQQLKFVQAAGIATTAFNPYTINAGAQTSTYDARYYLPVANFDQYDNTGYPVTADDNYKHIQTSFFDHLTKHPTVVFKNAIYKEVAFNDFDSQLAPGLNTFTVSGTGSYTPVGSHAGNAGGLATTQTVTSSTITKNLTAQNYIFSIWINAATAGTLTFTGISTNPTISYIAGSWRYYELKIPVTALGSPTFTLGFTSNQNISIDDILLYPDVAEATTATFDALGHYKIAQTNTNGISAYFTNDQWGRALYAFDQDKNIVLRKQYVSAANFQTFLTPTITNPGGAYNYVPATFTNSTPNTCLTDGMTYTWNFGDSTTPVVTSSYNSASHTYAANGSYTVTVTANSPLLGSKVGTLNVTVTNLPSTSIVYTNTCTPGGTIPSKIFQVKFLQGSTTVYTFTNAQLIAGVSIVPGSYTIQIYPQGTLYNSATNPTGYTTVTYSGAGYQCFTYNGSTFSTTDNTSYTPTIYFYIEPGACVGGPPE